MCDEDEEQNAANSLTLKSLCLPKIGAQAKELLLRSEEPSAREELREVISSAEAADLEFELWESSLPDSWLPKTVAVVNEIPLNPFTAEAWMGEMHIYEDLFMANITNDYRVSRIFCHTIIMSCVAALDPLQLDSEMTKLSKRAQFIVQKMVDDISSSVPFHMEYNLRRSPMDADYDSLSKYITKTTMHCVSNIILSWSSDWRIFSSLATICLYSSKDCIRSPAGLAAGSHLQHCQPLWSQQPRNREHGAKPHPHKRTILCRSMMNPFSFLF